LVLESVSGSLFEIDSLTMTTTHAFTRSSALARPWLSILFWHLILPLAFLAVMLLFYPYRGVFQFDNDEGINLMKAMLMRSGYGLYGQIWSDQPPLLTYLLYALFRFSGPSVNAARVMILLLSTILVWAFIQNIRLVWGNLHALFGVLLLLLVPAYLKLSLSVMIGLPSIAFAMLSLLALTYWHKVEKDRWLIISAVALGLSMLTKIFTGFLVPIFFAGLLVSRYSALREQKDWRTGLRPAGIWLATICGLTALLLILLVRWSNLYQIVLPHLFASQIDTFREADPTLTLWYHMRLGWIYLPLGILGAVYIFLEKRWLGLYPLAWAATALILLAEHAPVWYHQTLLLTIPIAMLAAGGLGEVIRLLSSLVQTRQVITMKSLVGLAMLVTFIAALFLQIPLALKQFSPVPIFARDERRPRAAENRFMKRIEKFAPQTHWIVTDSPMYAFRTGIPIPPNLVVFTNKRWLTGFLPDEELNNTFLEYNPEQVLLGRYDSPALQKILDQHYRLVHERNGVKIYIRKDL
jgi:4-amino-4-deoxy-L-arabinose transferase-like glycosyltransferase